MKSEYIKDKFEVINCMITKAKIASRENSELAIMLSSYLAVFISGIYEDCMESLFIQRAAQTGDSKVENFVKEAVHRMFRNPSFDNIIEILKCFDPSYKAILKTKVSTESISGINSIVTNKNNVAHGETASATIGDIEKYHSSAIKVFEKVEKILTST